jgi:hypothetical protein
VNYVTQHLGAWQGAPSSLYELSSASERGKKEREREKERVQYLKKIGLTK